MCQGQLCFRILRCADGPLCSGTHDDAVDGKEEEESTPAKVNRLLGYSGGEHAAAHDSEARAQRVPDHAPDGHAVRVLLRREGDGGDLGAVAPLRDKRQDEALPQHPLLELRPVLLRLLRCLPLLSRLHVCLFRRLRQLVLNLLELLRHVAGLHLVAVLEQPHPEDQEQYHRRVVRVEAREEGRQQPAETRGEDSHGGEGRQSSDEDNHARVLHRQDRSNEEGLVTKL
mmetsp:Transcript_87966/g.131854  ORF Transcript_87966/g.131854 Transcript_87966/m.131854 type:complete len:228 (-) Transcript_87966:120-803(-)